MTNLNTPTSQPTLQVNDTAFAFAVYALYLIGFFTGFTAAIGVIIAHVRAPTAQGIWQSHFQFQIRTFWIGLLYVVLGYLLMAFIIGFAVLAWWAIWTLVRVIKGAIFLNDRRPIPQPASWLFG